MPRKVKEDDSKDQKTLFETLFREAAYHPATPPPEKKEELPNKGHQGCRCKGPTYYDTAKDDPIERCERCKQYTFNCACRRVP